MLCSSQPQRCRRVSTAQPAASGEGASSRGDGGGRRTRARRESVTSLVPQQGEYHRSEVTQRGLYSILRKFGALGFEVAGGAISQQLEDLPEGGTVKLVVLPPRPDPLEAQVWPPGRWQPLPCLRGQDGPPIARMHAAGSTACRAATPCSSTSCLLCHAPAAVCLLPPAMQVRQLQRAVDDRILAEKQQLAAFLRGLASSEAHGAPVTMLQTAPFTGADGQVLRVRAGLSGLQCRCELAAH